MAAKTGTWIGGAVALALVMGAGTWFLAVSPTLSEASETRLQTQATEDQNDMLRTRIAKLEKDFDNLPQYEADLAAARVGIPSSLEMAAYLRQVESAGQTAGIAVIDITPGTPATVQTITPAAPAESTTTDEATDDTAAAEATTGTIDGFVGVPISVTVLGNYPAALQFLSLLQGADQRLIFVGAISAAGQAEAEASQGRPATAEGDVEMTISGFVYVLTDPAEATTPTTEPTTPAELP